VLRQVEEAELCFDVGHAQTYEVRRNGRADVRELVNTWFRELGDVIKGVHLYDCLIQGRWVEGHVSPTIDSPAVSTLIEARKTLGNRLDFTVLEAFKNRNGDAARPVEVAEVVELMKKQL